MAGKHDPIIAPDAEPEFSLNEFCEACQITPDFIQELIEYGAIEPIGFSIETWRFGSTHLRRVQRVVRLQHDLEVNIPGAALAIDLMEQIEQLQAEVDLLHKHLYISVATRLK